MSYQISFAVLFIALDVISGVAAALYTKSFKSAKMRSGLYHKGALLLVLVAATAAHYAQLYIDLGFNVPVVSLTSIYIIFMELASFFENIHTLNPDLSIDAIKKIFGGDRDV